jgi:release factor glutamine methyltransferase
MTYERSEATAVDVSHWLAAAEDRLVRLGVTSPRSEALQLLHLAMKRAANDLATPLDKAMGDVLRAREAYRSIARISGSMNFCGLQLALVDGVYEPCPSSQRLIEFALAWASEKTASLNILDIGTGCGNMLLALLQSLPNARGLGVDISSRAIGLARSNAKTVGVASRCSFVEGDAHELGLKDFDLVVSTLPWIGTSAISKLRPEVRLYDPLEALDGGSDGLCHMRQLDLTLDRLLSVSGSAFIQLGYEVVQRVREILERRGRNVTTLRDGYGFPIGLSVLRTTG